MAEWLRLWSAPSTAGMSAYSNTGWTSAGTISNCRPALIIDCISIRIGWADERIAASHARGHRLIHDSIVTADL